jgi:rhamnose utilization protein RhaD (predicted bifunctional aldolase and dehydrogenase)
MSIDLKDLIEVSRKYGCDPAWVLAGGGNTSMKEDGVLYVKASGAELATISENGFVRMSMYSLNSVWDKQYSEAKKEREAEVLDDMLNARLEGETARPSVEALLHSLIKVRLVVHTHPAVVNGLTCSRDGEKMTAELFGEQAIWIPLVDPGYTLANEIRRRIEEKVSGGKPYPDIIFLQNHGLFVSGETTQAIEKIQKNVVKKIEQKLDRKPVDGVKIIEEGSSGFKDFMEEAVRVFGNRIVMRAVVNEDILDFAKSAESFEPLRLPLTPDQIVYSGPGPVRIDSIGELSGSVLSYIKQWKRRPQGILVKGLGLFAVGENEKKADNALALLLDSIKIAVYCESFGGVFPMSRELIIFIRDWEVEHYRAKVQ